MVVGTSESTAPALSMTGSIQDQKNDTLVLSTRICSKADTSWTCSGSSEIDVAPMCKYVRPPSSNLEGILVIGFIASERSYGASLAKDGGTSVRSEASM
ncbi:hypothetical protein PC110_g5131 [Phytophthora cactorum]|uniref:Uncharacterized protein n=1 Tax=Phytophthora cactorum TaxID=29920 RepID=A0A329SPQ7_9STRA|nr:hypothetical protein PC110_g5131 [Phytophthora cactorum]